MEKRIFGFKKSKLDGTEKVYGVGITSNGIPEEYTYQDFLPNVLDQGNDPICVPCSLSAYINWKLNLTDGSKSDNHVEYEEIFDYKNSSDGMSFKDALHFLRHTGVTTDEGVVKIKKYAMLKSIYALKSSIIMNGPAVGGLPVYNYSEQFWKPMYGDELIGYHAVALVGYDKESLIVRNSWGRSYGKNGYGRFDYEDLNRFIELWAIL